MIINRIHTILAPTATNPSSIHRVETDTSGVMIRMKDESGVSWFTPSDLACLLFESRFEQTIAAMPQDEPSLSEAPAPTECSKAPIPVHEEDCTNNDLMEKLELILSSQTSLGQQMQALIGRVGAVFKPEPSRRESSSLPPHLTSLLSYFGLPAPSAPAQSAKSSLEALLSVLVADDREEPKDGPTPGCDCPRCQALRAFASGDDTFLTPLTGEKPTQADLDNIERELSRITGKKVKAKVLDLNKLRAMGGSRGRSVQEILQALFDGDGAAGTK